MIRLNPRQKEAAEFLYGTACVIACPGSGKTLTMTHRIANLVNNHGVAPERICGLTFTRNAAQAMREKLYPILEDLAARVDLATIHSFCHSLLRQEGKTFEIIHGNEQLKFLRQVMSKRKIRNIPVGMVIREISLAKNNIIDADEFADLYTGDETMLKIAAIYEAYEAEKKKKLQFDFTDLLFESYLLLKEENEVRQKYQDSYSHLLIDEFQDVGPLQVEILKQLINNHRESSFWVCADDCQSIYSFTGASVGNILNFDKVFQNSQQFILDTNYRSTPEILSCCQRLIDHNTKKIDKVLRTENPTGAQVAVIDSTNEEDEALQLVNEIKGMTETGSYQFKDIAVLYRANSLSRPIEDGFKQHQIPYHIENGSSFYQRHEVKVLLDYLRFINNPDSDDGDDALRKIINIPNRYIGKTFMTGLESFSNKRNAHLFQGLKTMPIEVPYLKKFIKDFVCLIEPLIQDAAQLEPAEIIHILREGLDYDRYISDDDIPSPDDSKIENINQLQLVSAKYKDIPALLNYTETFKEENSNNKDGVALMTVHKSKGLEFPVVFVIGMTEGVMPNKQGEIEEERRICFVGISRAMNMLYLTYPINYMGKNATRSRFLDEILKEE
jgi:DNA helicase-2/ATP-dependent DNA helicase PcrA